MAHFYMLIYFTYSKQIFEIYILQSKLQKYTIMWQIYNYVPCNNKRNLS